MKFVTLAVMVAFCALTQPSYSQNLFKNSTFDSDTRGWDTGTYSVWSAEKNYSGGNGGSLSIVSSGIDYAEQCARLTADRTYVLLLDTLDDGLNGERCVGASFAVEVMYWRGNNCDFSLARDNYLEWLRQEGENPFDWFIRRAVLTVPSDVNSTGVVLSAECPTHRGTTEMYFDNVELLTDTILRSSFE